MSLRARIKAKALRRAIGLNVRTGGPRRLSYWLLRRYMLLMVSDPAIVLELLSPEMRGQARKRPGVRLKSLSIRDCVADLEVEVRPRGFVDSVECAVGFSDPEVDDG